MTATTLTYFQETSEELLSMGVALLIEGWEVGWAKSREIVLALFKAKFTEMNSSQINLITPAIKHFSAKPPLADP